MNTSPDRVKRAQETLGMALNNTIGKMMEENDSKILSSETHNLERDLRSTAWIIDKAKNSAKYAQHVYAALCQNEFVHSSILEQICDNRWSCSWRYAGGIVANMIERGDYMDYYCSGIMPDYEVDNREVTYVPEGTVTDEIREDFLKMGWIIKDRVDE